jgi:hypothetical protein
MYKNTLVLVCLFGLLNACADGDWPIGDLVVTNADGAATITDIYINVDCTDSWGNVDATGLSIAPGASSTVFELETRIYDVLACFDTGFCGQALDVEVYDFGTTEVLISDGGTIVSAPANCL